eukprot:PLAT5326.1.p1 GENE.PLAT5326.1~~PLAT5326.1.p1  ORF type:complete len:889 (-),score=513.32 PLAT5326.1:1745-4411(-)
MGCTNSTPGTAVTPTEKPSEVGSSPSGTKSSLARSVTGTVEESDSKASESKTAGGVDGGGEHAHASGRSTDEGGVTRFHEWTVADGASGSGRVKGKGRGGISSEVGTGGRPEEPGSVREELEAVIPEIAKDAGTQALIRRAIEENMLFASMNEEQLQRCIGAMTQLELSAGSAAITRGERGEHFYVVHSGGFDVMVKRAEDAEELLVAHFGPGGTFGELALMYSMARTATVVASEDSTLWALDRRTYRTIMLRTDARYHLDMDQFCRGVPLFLWLPDEDRSRLVDTLASVTLRRGDSVADLRGELGMFWVVKSGVLHVARGEEAEAGGGAALPSEDELRDGEAAAERKEALPEGSSSWLLYSGAWLGGGEAEQEQVLLDVASIAQPEPLTRAGRGHVLLGSSAEALVRVASETATLYTTTMERVSHFLSAAHDRGDSGVVALLKRIALFGELEEGELAAVAERVQTHVYADGATICHEGDVGDEFFMIVRGEVSVRAGGKEVLRLRDADYFGEIALLDEEAKRTADVVAAGPVTLLSLHGEQFRSICPEAVLEALRSRSYLSQLAKTDFRWEDLEVRRTLGVGSFGHVRLCLHKPTGRPYALKCMEKKKILRMGQRQHILNEREILAEVDHSCITKLHATFQSLTHLYMLMDVNQGGELFSLLVRCNSLDEESAMFYAAALSLVLEHLHSRNVVYRDLKPENVLLDMRGYVKMVDFGFAKKVIDRTYTLCGTPEYLAPEIILNNGHSCGVDWWALGVFIYEMLAGFTPFTRQNTIKNDMDIFRNIIKHKIDYPSHFSAEACDLVGRLMSKDPDKRSGWLTGSLHDIEKHAWFKDFSFEAMLEGTIVAPYVPELADEMDLSNFDDYDDDGDMMDPFDPPDAARSWTPDW